MASPTDPFGTGIDRTFAGDPYAPPRAPAARATPPQGSPVEMSNRDSGATTLNNPGLVTGPKKAPVFRALKTRDGQGWEVFARTEEGSKSLGKANIKDADVVLKELGVYDDVSQAYTIPEAAVNSLTAGRLPFPEYLAARFEAGEAGVIRNFIGRKYLSGGLAREDAVARGHDPLLKVQLGSAPEFAWDGGFGEMVVSAIRHPGEAFRFAAGEAAEQLPIMRGALVASLKGATAGAAAGGAAAAAGMATGPVGAATTAGVATVGARVGAGIGSMTYFIDMEAGSTAMEMLEAGYDDKTIRRIAPLAGVVKGTLEQASFGVMTAPFKRAFVKNVMLTTAMQNVIVSGAAQYAKSVGAEVTTEEMQSLVDIMANNWASIVDEKPELFTNAAEAKKQLWETFVKTAAAAGLMGAPGAVLDGMHSRGEAKKPAEKPAAKAEEKKPAEKAAPKELEAKPAPRPVDAPAPVALKTEPIEAPAPAPEAAAPAPAPVEALPAGQTPEQIAEWATERPWYHGSGAADLTTETLSPHMTRVEGLLGAGVYVTNDPAVAQTYADKRGRRTGTPTVYELGVAVDRVLDAEQAAPAPVVDAMVAAMPDDVQGDIAAAAAKPGATLATIWKAMGESLAQSEISSAELAENFQILTAALREMGYDAIRYAGGGRTGNTAHEAMVLLDPNAETTQFTKDGVSGNLADRKNVKSMGLRKAAPEADFYDMVDGPAAAIAEGTPEQAADAMAAFDEQENGLVPLEPPASPPPIEGELDFYEAEERALAKLRKPFVHEFKESQESDRVDPVNVSWTDIFTPDPHLAQKNPMYAFIVLGVDAMRAKHGAVYTEFRQALFDLGEKATKSRERGLADKLAPQMPAVFEFLNAETPAAEKAAWAKLTPQEKRFAGFVRAALDRAYEYLTSVEGMKSRFAPEGEKGYTPYTPKPVSEIIRGLPEKGWKKTMQSLWEAGVKRFDTDFSLGGASGKISRPKFFKHALFRSGEIDPSLNVIKSIDNYFRAFAAKRALDEASPVIEAGVREFVAHTDQKTPAVRALNAKLEKFIGQYMAKEKGQSILSDVIPHGSGGEALLRGTATLMSLLRIAGNIKLQAISGVGEAVSASGAVGLHGLSQGECRLFVERAKSKAILKKYAEFVGESPEVEFSHPGRNIEDQFRQVAYGILGWSRANIMHAAFLASMTDEEFANGEISDARLAGLKVTLGRFMGLPGNRSAFGATPLGLNATQFKAWAVPSMLTIKEDVGAMVSSFMETGNPVKQLTPLQKLEVVNMSVTLAVAALGSAAFLGSDPRKDGPAARKLRQEIWSLLGALDPVIVLGVGATIPWLLRVSASASMLARGMVTSRREGKRMRKQGWSRLKTENTPSAVRQFQKKKKRR